MADHHPGLPRKTPYPLGAVRSPDDNRDHPLAAHLLFVETLPRKSTPKVTIPVNDQGQTPMCVGFSGATQRSIGERLAEKEPIRFDGTHLYEQAKLIDGSPNEDGTYIRAAASVLKNLGGKVSLSRAKGVHKGDMLKIAAYARLTSLHDIKEAVYALGSAWVGSDWYNSWFDPDPLGTGFVLPKPDDVAGGHAYSIIGYDDDYPYAEGTRGAFLMQNNWGKDWAKSGRAWLPYEYIDFSTFEAWRTFDVAGDL